ncbi:MAG: polysaccharide biosynthesis tyrosine autokinase [Elainellaceae cyanobacterium]
MKTEQHLRTLPTANVSFPNENTDEGGLDFGKLWAILRRRALLIAGVTTAVTLGAGVMASSEPPVYEGNFEILIQASSAEQEVTSSVPAALPDQGNKGVNRQDLLKILVSPSILNQVVAQIQQESPETCQQIVFPQNEDGTIAVEDISEEELAERCSRGLLSNLTVETLDDKSSIIRVTYQGETPEEVTNALNATSDKYLDYSLESRQADIQRGIEFVETKLPDLRDNVALLQDQLQQLRQRYNLITPDARGSELSGQVSSFRQQYLESQIELEQARTSASELQGELSQSSPELAASSTLSGNNRYQNLIGELLSLDAQIAQASTIYLGTTPELQVLQEQRQNLLSLLSREGQVVERQVDGDLRVLQARDQALEQTLGSLSTEVDELAVISRVYTDIERELNIATENLNDFLAKREALQIDAAQRQIPWVLLTPTTDPNAISASLPQNLVIGSILGFLLGIGAAMAIERLTDVIYNSNDLKRLTGLPLLGAIPTNASLRGRSGARHFSASLQKLAAIQQEQGGVALIGRGSSPSGYSADPFSEAFRSLYASIRLLNSDDPIRSLVISSTQPGEGKSTTAVHLAAAAAAMTQRVLLVETDLRNPKLHQYLDLHNSGGLIDVLSGDLALRDAVQRSPIEPNLFVLTAGAIPPDPTRALSSQKMQRLMEQFHSNFDFVIYDAPPLLDFADAYLTAAHTDGVVFVTQVGKLKRSLLEQVLEKVKVSKTTMLGVVLQKVSAS